MSATAALTLEQGMAHLASIVGAGHVQLHGETISAAPADVCQTTEILRFAHASQLAVAPSGGGTKLGWGNPVSADIQLNLHRLDSLRDHPWQDMTCTVEAGCPWADLQTQLRRHGQMVALDPLWPDRATVGGIVACNDSGALRLKYGGLRDLIIGMTVVLADGTIAKSGGKVVKNVAGYDIHKLMTGSFGTLGVITEVNFRLHPVEEHARTWTAVAAGASAFAAPLKALLDSQMTPSGIQIRTSSRQCALDIRIAGVASCLDEYGERLQTLFGRTTLSLSDETAWQCRQQLFDGADSLVLKLSLNPSDICSTSAQMQQWATGGELDLAAVAHSTGLVTVALKSPPRAAATAFVERLRAHAQSSGGSVIALQIPGDLRGAIDVWGPDPPTLPLMREIKRRFDPRRILNPGRFVGNI